MSERKILAIGAVLFLVLGFGAAWLRRHDEPALQTPGRTVSRPALPQAGAAQSSGFAANPPAAASQDTEFDQAERLFQQGKYAEAIPLYRSVLTRGENPRAMTSLAVALRQTGESAEAKQLLERSLQLEPTGLETRYFLGLVQQYDLGDYDAAIASFEQVLPHMPPDQVDELKNNVEYLRTVRDTILRNHAAEAVRTQAGSADTPPPAPVPTP